MDLLQNHPQQIAEQRGGAMAVGVAQRRAPHRIETQLGQPRRVALQFRDDRPKAPTAARTAELAFAVQHSRGVIRALDQLLETGVRDMLQKLVQHGILVGHDVAPVSRPDRLKRPECDESQCRAPDEQTECRTVVSINSAILEWPGSSDKPTRRWAVTMAARWTCRVVAARRSAAA